MEKLKRKKKYKSNMEFQNHLSGGKNAKKHSRFGGLRELAKLKLALGFRSGETGKGEGERGALLDWGA